MSALSGKKVLLGITGGIAAYKTTYLVRLLIKAGAEVKVVMTREATDFVTPLSLATLSKNSVEFAFTEEDNRNWNNHVELGKWADLMCIAPLTANTLSKIVNGHSDNFLMAVYLSTDCPVYLAPAMDLDMYQHPTTKANLNKLLKFGHHIIPAESGELASGLSGEGRMAEPEHIFNFIENHLAQSLPLYGKKVMVSAGPTQEAIDPVRFISNRSSGKMGYACAEVAAQKGASVILVSGPSALSVKNPNIQLQKVVSAKDMYEAVHRHFEEVDVFISAAAVSDYRPKTIADQKIKKAESELHLELEKTQDILLSLKPLKTHQIMVGFAMETDNELENAKDKLMRKGLDLIVLNSLRDAGAGFQGDTNKVKIIKKDIVKDFPLKTKTEVAEDILAEVCEVFEKKPSK